MNNKLNNNLIYEIFTKNANIIKIRTLFNQNFTYYICVKTLI